MEPKVINPFPLKIFSGEGNIQLATDVATILKKELGKRFYKEFAEGELLTHQAETVRDCDVVIIFQVQITPELLYKHIWESLELIRAIRGGTPFKIRVIYPLIPFSRQDRASKQREFSTFKLLCDMIYTAGADEIYTLHLHNLATVDFFSYIGSKAKMENATLNDFFLDHIQHNLNISAATHIMGGPDISAGKSARAFAKKLGIGTVIVDKDRQANESETSVMEVIGDPEGLHVMFFDDMIASAGSCKNAADAVRNKGAVDVSMFAPHLVYSGKTWQNLADANFNEIWVTDTCNIPKDKILPNMRVFTVATMIARIIDNAHNGVSVSDIWNGH